MCRLPEVSRRSVKGQAVNAYDSVGPMVSVASAQRPAVHTAQKHTVQKQVAGPRSNEALFEETGGGL